VIEHVFEQFDSTPVRSSVNAADGGVVATARTAGEGATERTRDQAGG
jgi:hypothetical protein